ncbi:MAG: bifunctional [glutamate--ammonia ligase]-adenylyl-L-tyrosine phosphorylase/[glutamate--ammonia-ligase] adenylyltransferase, partial [Candidatus Binatia bacterium]
MDDLRKILAAAPRPLRAKIDKLIQESPSPSLARANLERLLEFGGLKALKQLPLNYLPALFQLLGGSLYLNDILIREGAGWPELFFQQTKVSQKSVPAHLRELSRLLSPAVSMEEFCRALRRHKQRDYLRIGARDLSRSQTVEETMRELTALAEASLETAYLFCRSQVEKDFGPLRLPSTGRDNRFVVLGMGKLGGEELNFSSDIDLIYLYEEGEGESAGGRKGKIGPRDFFTRLGEMLIRAMGEVTEEGFVFRTDLRLRPLGRHGPLVQSVGSALLYYESWGQCWERSALIKARPVAGDRELGLQFLREVEPFIYRRYLDFTTVEELREMKRRIERELLDAAGKERNVKLGRGGIREIEFFTQALQLVNGGYQPEIRDHSTVRALERLARLELISSRDKNSLSRAYRFLRDVEHKLQMVQEAHTHDIPVEEDEERALARRLGYRGEKGAEERALFWKDYRIATASVRRAFDRLFYGAQREMAPERGSAPEEIWNHLDDEETILKKLAELGLADPERAYQDLLALRDGAPYSPPSPRRIKVMRTLGPALMAEILKSGAPEQALFNLSEFTHRVGARTGFLSLLAENPKTTHLLVSLFASSQFLTELFLKRPELLDSLIRADLTRLRKTKSEMLDDLAAALVGREDLEERLNALRRYRAEEFIRIGLHDLGRELELEDVLEQLSSLAEACLEGAFTLALQEMEKGYGKVSEGQFAILGMGK